MYRVPDVSDVQEVAEQLGATTATSSTASTTSALGSGPTPTASTAEVFAVPFASVGSPKVYFPQWKQPVTLCASLVAEHADLAGIVIGHGTASLEETAYFLGLTLKVPIPVVVVGSQRPMSGLFTDAKMNLVNAVRTAASPARSDVACSFCSTTRSMPHVR